MKNIKAPDDKLQQRLFLDEDMSWWAAKLSPNALRSLERGWQGTFRRSILKLMPAEQIGEHFSEDIGRPSKELYSMAGLMLIAEFKGLTGEQTAEAYTFDASIQYALNLPRDHQYLSSRSVDNYRKRFREDELAQKVFLQVSATLVEELEIDIARQRLDSTHVLSNMAKLGRQQLLSVGVKRFLTQLKKHHASNYEGLPAELRERYAPAETRLFGQGTTKAKKGKEVLEQIGQDMAALIGEFGGHERISKMKSYQAMVRLFEEHFKPPQDPGKPHQLRPRSKDSNGGSTRTLQNPSDSGAGFDGNKGSGYQAQIAQSLPSLDKEGKAEGPGLITGLLPQSAAVRDNEALPEMLDQQQKSGLAPKELTADTLYGSDENTQHCAQQGINLISPVGGRTPTESEPKHNCSRQERERKQRLEQRRQEQKTERWKNQYAQRSGIEGLNRALDCVTGFKRLRVRGESAVTMALYLKGAGWNILTASKIRARRLRHHGQGETLVLALISPISTPLPNPKIRQNPFPGPTCGPAELIWQSAIGP